MSHEEDPKRRVGEVIAGKYRLERLLGAGGMGAVYAATHEFTKRTVAVKLMHEPFAKSKVFAERFVREAQAPSAIGHPGIAEVLDGGFDQDGSLYLVLEMLQGDTLGDLQGQLSVSELVDLIRQLLYALAAAHDAGFVHRDIKPDNVFVVRDPTGRRKVKLLDFGVAGVLDAERGETHLTQTGTILGTPLFMSPEQAKGERVDHRSDLWAVGAILYEALAGHPPYDAETYNAVIVSIVTREHVPLQRVRPDLPRPLLEVIERALRKDVNERWQSANEMATALASLPNLEACSAVVPKRTDHEATADTFAARPGSKRPKRNPNPEPAVIGDAEVRAALHSAALPSLARPVIAQTDVGAPARAPATSSVTARDPVRSSTAAAEPAASAVPWVAAAALVVVLALGFAVYVTRARERPEPPIEPAALAAAPPAVADSLQAAANAPAVEPVLEQPEARPANAELEATQRAPAAAAQGNEEPALAPLDSNDLSRALVTGQAKLQRCYQDLIGAQLLAGGAPPAAVKLDVTLRVAANGEVRDASIEGQAPEQLTGCMREHLRRFQFRPSSEDTELNFPVVFQPAVIAP